HLPDSIFRDEHYIRPSEPIGETIRRALSRSEYLIYLASPQAATSRWVYDELEYWLSDPERSKRFLVVVTDGVFEFSAQQKEMIDKKRTDIFPKALVPKLAQPGLLIDFRNHEATAQLNLDDPNTKAKINQIVAKLKGITPGEMIDRALLESRRLRRFRTISFCVLIILMTMGMTASWLAWKQLNIALMAESRAIAQLSHQERRRGNATRAIATALSALPDYDRVLKRPLSSEAQRALVEARYERREIGVLKGHRMGYISTIGINPGQDTIWSGSHDGTVRLWSLKTGRALALLSGHQESISQVRFNEDASLIASASTDDTVRLWRADNGWIEPSVLHHSFDVTALVLSASGTTLITTSSNREGAVIDFEGAVTVWSTISGAKLSELRGESFGGGQTVFRLKDGKFIVGLQANTLILELMDDGDLKVLNTFEGVSILALDPHEENFIGQSAGGAQIRRINDGVLVASLEDHLDLVQAADISPDGKFAVTGSRDGTARLWQVATGRLLAILRGHEDWVTSVAFSTNGEKVVTASDDGAARLFDVRLDSSARYNAGHPLHGSTIGRQIAEFRGHLAPVSEAMFAPGDEMVITAAGDGTVRTWRSGIGVEITRLDTHDGRLSGAFFGSDGNWLVSGPLPGEEAFVWSTTEGKRGRSLGTNVVASAVSPKVDVVATVDDTGLQLRNAITLEIIGEFPARSGLGKPHFSPDGLRVAVKNHFSDNISLLSGENAHQFAQIEAPADLRSFVFSPDGKALLTWSSDNTASLWDSETGAEERIFQGHTGPVNSATFSHDGNYVITGSDDETVIVWERFTGAQRTRFGRLAGAVTSVAAQENGSQIAAATIGGKAYVWTSAADTAPMVLSGDHIFSSGEIAFTLDGQRLIRRSVTGEIVVWETATGRQLLATEQNVTSGANWGFIGPNGRIMATPTGADVTIFDLTDGSKVANLRGHLSEVDHVMFSPDGRKLLTSAIDEQSLVWPIFEIDAEFLSDSKEIVTRLRMP
ncbi:MAG: TIR domain-containing protein, partial [Pseudomonadota bacterium]